MCWYESLSATHRAGDPAGVIFCDNSLQIASNIASSKFLSGLHARCLLQGIAEYVAT